MRRNVRNLVEVLGSHLTNVKINHVAIVSIDLIKFFRIQGISVNPVLNVHMLVRKDHRGVSVVVSRSFPVEDLEVLRNLILINFEEEVRFSLDIAIHVLRESLPLFALKLLLESESIKLLLNKSGNASLDLFEVIMVTVLDFRDLGEDSLLLLRGSQLREPLGLSGGLLTLLFVIGLRVRLQLLVLASIESCVIDFSLSCQCSFLSLDKVLDCYAAESTLAHRVEQARQGPLVCCCTLKEHIF